MHVGFAVPQIAEPQFLPRLRAFLEFADCAGFDSLWVYDQPIGASPTLEPITLLAYMAEVTQRVSIGTAVLIAGLRDPLVLAAAIAAIDRVSVGRLILGVGLGRHRSYFRSVGAPVERLDDSLAVTVERLREAWAGTSPSHGTDSFRIPAVAQPFPPVIVGGRTRRALQEAATSCADGWVGEGASSTTAFMEQADVVRSHRAKSEARRFQIGKRLFVCFDPSMSRARRRARRWFSRFYGDPELAERVAVIGDAAAITYELHLLNEAGADFVIVSPTWDALQVAIAIADALPPSLELPPVLGVDSDHQERSFNPHQRVGR